MTTQPDYAASRSPLIRWGLLALAVAIFGGAALAIHQEREKRRLAEYRKGVITLGQHTRWSPLWSLMDQVSLYQKHGFVEHYGLDFRERRGGPIRLSHSELHVTHDQSWLVWWPDHSPARGAEQLEIAFAGEPPRQGTLTVGLVMESGETQLFEYEMGPEQSSPQGDPPFVSEEFTAALNAAADDPVPLVAHENRLLAPLPDALQEQLNRDHAVRAWFIGVRGAAGSTISIEHISLQRRSAAETATIVLKGRVLGLGQGDVVRDIELLLETGQRRKQQVADGGQFVFEGVPAGVAVSLGARRRQQHYYTTLGRWFVPREDLSELVINVQPAFNAQPIGRRISASRPIGRTFPAGVAGRRSGSGVGRAELFQ